MKICALILSFSFLLSIQISGQEPNQDLSIKILSTDSDARVILEIEYPQEHGGNVNIKLFDNGKEITFEPVGGGFGGGVEQKDISFIPATFGKHVIKVVGREGNKTTQASIEFDYRPRPLLEPLWTEDELFLQLRSLTVKERYVDSLSIRINGKTAMYKYWKDMSDDFSRTAVVVEPELQSGLNRVELSAVTYDGKTARVNTSCYYAKDSVVAKGDSFNLVYGEVGTKSGPFYSVKIEGSAVKETADIVLENGKLVKTLKGVRQGQATIRIFKKPHFLESERLERSFTLTVR